MRENLKPHRENRAQQNQDRRTARSASSTRSFKRCVRQKAQTIAQLVDLTDWPSHSVRGAMSGAVPKKRTRDHLHKVGRHTRLSYQREATTARKEAEKVRGAIWESIIDRAEVLHDACVIRDRSAAAVERHARDITSFARTLRLVGAKPRHTQ